MQIVRSCTATPPACTAWSDPRRCGAGAHRRAGARGPAGGACLRLPALACTSRRLASLVMRRYGHGDLARTSFAQKHQVPTTGGFAASASRRPGSPTPPARPTSRARATAQARPLPALAAPLGGTSRLHGRQPLSPGHQPHDPRGSPFLLPHFLHVGPRHDAEEATVERPRHRVQVIRQYVVVAQVGQRDLRWGCFEGATHDLPPR